MDRLEGRPCVIVQGLQGRYSDRQWFAIYPFGKFVDEVTASILDQWRQDAVAIRTPGDAGFPAYGSVRRPGAAQLGEQWAVSG